MADWAWAGACTGVLKNYIGLVLVRFFLGVVEAPFYLLCQEGDLNKNIDSALRGCLRYFVCGVDCCCDLCID
jgi:hypothetical protein